MLRMLTGLKFPILVLSVPPLSSGTTAARLAYLGKFEVRILLFIASVTGLIRALLAIFLPIWVVLDLHQLIFLDLCPGRYVLFLFPALRENGIIRYQFYYS